MINGKDLNLLTDVYNEFKRKYLNNRELLKDHSHRTIELFIQNFMQHPFNSQIQNSINYENFYDFTNSFFEEFLNLGNCNQAVAWEESSKFNESLNGNSNLNPINFIKNKEEIFYLKLFFFDSCLNEFIGIQIDEPNVNANKYAEIIFQFFKIFITKFDLLSIISNVKIFNFYIKQIIRYSVQMKDSYLNIKSIFDSINGLVTNDNKRIILNLLFINKIIVLKKFDFESNEQNDIISKIYQNNLESFIELLINRKKLINLLISNSNLGGKFLSITSSNLVNIFKSIFKKLKSFSIKLFNNSIELFINKLQSRSNSLMEADYETFIFIFVDIFDSLLVEDISETRLELLFKILESNLPILHKLSVNFLEKIRDLNYIENNFLGKYISVFDVLDGYNSHLFKGLWKDMEYVINKCENFIDEIDLKDEICYIKKGNNNQINIKEIFSIPYNYFLIISHKIMNHENTRIQKFFIKSFTNMCASHNLKNKFFEDFLYSTLLKMLNNPLFYPENESISYHAKVGIIAENLYSNWFKNILSCSSLGSNLNTGSFSGSSKSSLIRLESNLNKFLKGVVERIDFKRIFNYLMNSISKVFDKNLNLYLTPEIFENIQRIIDKNIKYLSFYQRQKCWEAIESIFLNDDFINNLSNENFEVMFQSCGCYLINIFHSITKYSIFKENNSYLSVRNVDIFDNNKLYKFGNFFSFFKNVFQKGIHFSTSESENFKNLIDNFIINNKTRVKNFDKLNDNMIITLFWFNFLNRYEKSGNVINNFSQNLIKLTSPYITQEYKQLILNNLITLLNMIDYFSSIKNFYEGNDGNEYEQFRENMNKIFYSLNEPISTILELLNDYFHSLVRCLHSNNNISISKEILFVRENFYLIEDNILKHLTINLEKTNNKKGVVSNIINIFKLSNSIEKVFSNQDGFKLTSTKIICLDYVLSYVKIVEMQMSLIFNHREYKSLVKNYFSVNENIYEFKKKINRITQYINNIETMLEKEILIWIKDDQIKETYNKAVFLIIKIKTLFTMQIKEFSNLLLISEEEKLYLVELIFKNNLSSYATSLLEFLEKSNDECIYYVLKLLNLGIEIFKGRFDDHFFNNFIKIGLNTLTEKREYLNFMNVTTFLCSFINQNVLCSNENITELVSKTLHTLFDLNEKRTWLVLRISCDLLLPILIKSPTLIIGLSSTILEMAESKETRGEDSFMLQTNPQYLFSPFNISSANLIKNFLINEEICKYGLYVRVNVLTYFENLINSLIVDESHENKIIIESLLFLIENILNIIDTNSAQKTEMQFTSKHRKKLRLSQFLLVLSQIFLKIDTNLILYQNKLDSIEKLIIKIFAKVNLQSVRFYIDLFCINLARSKISFLNYLINVLSNINSKTHCATSSLIILSILSLEGNFKFQVPVDSIIKIYELITSLCTSNVCNIRGFAQYFLCKVKSKTKNEIYLENKINISNFFFDYLLNNSNIQRFFNKFDEIYEKFCILIREFNVENLLKSNFDEVNCEIIPIDIMKDFKEMALEMVVLDNEDLSKPYISWRYHLEDTDDKLKIEKNFDFQKKYRPLEEKAKKSRLDVVVMASLIDKAPNLGGLARTCEVFNIGTMTINSDTFLNDNAFLTAAASAERWLPIISLPTCEIEKFIKCYKKLGYTIIGLEQTANSISLKEFNFQEKCLIILGNEKEGIPQNLIQLIDYCVIIPQFGEIRSLNVHVSAALMLWELVNCCNK